VSDPSRDHAITESWTDNAAAWTQVVRDGLIPSRQAGTDAAIVAACLSCGTGPLLDVGCGEGWLVRAVASQGVTAHGVDVSTPLIDRARELGGGRFDIATYAQLEGDASIFAGPWQTIVCNFALLGDPLHPVLAALRRRLAPGGRVLVQTVHAWTARGDAPYHDGWRTERFDAIVLDQSARLERWAALLLALSPGVREVWSYANNHYAGHGPATIRDLRARVEAASASR
jgi:2-polyprenyl-3-methyl-5-hydroxy-6-metoxy-1,4-benzoquinol methylase